MDQIAAAASVSKQTVYKQFADKQSLFREIVTGTVAEISDPVAEQVASLRDSTDLAADLRGLARALLAQVLQPRMMQLRRLVIGEAGRFPELGRLFYDSGPGRTIDALAAVLKASPPAGRCGYRTRGWPPSSSTGWSCRPRSTGSCSAAMPNCPPKPTSTATPTPEPGPFSPPRTARRQRQAGSPGGTRRPPGVSRGRWYWSG